MAVANPLAFLRARRAEFRFGLRVAVAGLVSYGLAELLDLSQGYWAVFTSVIVIQATIGASLKASVDRLIGTIGGALYGGTIAYFLPHDTEAATALALAVSLVPLGALAAFDDRFRVAPVTAVILLLVPSAPEIGPIAFTGERIVEIALGGAVAIAVALTVLPARAHGILAEAVNRLLGLVADQLPLLLDDIGKGARSETFLGAQPAVRKAIAGLDSAAEEARRERRIHLTDDPDPDPIVRTATRLRNDLVMMSRAVAMPVAPSLAARLSAPAAEVARAGAAQLRAIVQAFGSRRAPPPPDAVAAAIAAYQAAMATIRSEGLARPLDADAAARLFSLAFALEQFGQDVADMTARVEGFARPPAAG